MWGSLNDGHSPHQLTNFSQSIKSFWVYILKSYIRTFTTYNNTVHFIITYCCFCVLSNHCDGVKMQAVVIREEASSYVSLKTCNLQHSIIQTCSIMPIFYASKPHTSYSCPWRHVTEWNFITVMKRAGSTEDDSRSNMSINFFFFFKLARQFQTQTHL